jgi:hypothetical protein
MQGVAALRQRFEETPSDETRCSSDGDIHGNSMIARDGQKRLIAIERSCKSDTPCEMKTKAPAAKPGRGARLQRERRSVSGQLPCPR